MTAFAAALSTLHADPNMGEAAYFRRPPYTWQAVRVIRSQPTDITGTVIAGRLHVDILAAEITDEPERDDEVRIGSTVYVVESAERDVLALSWRITLADRN